MPHYQPRRDERNYRRPSDDLTQLRQFDNLLRSCPCRVIEECRKIGIPSLACLPSVDLLRAKDPARYEVLAAEASAQGFPVR